MLKFNHSIATAPVHLPVSGLLAALAAGLALAVQVPTFAQTSAPPPALDADQIVAALSAPQGASTRSFIPTARPDVATRVCDAQLNATLLERTGTRGEELTRTLYVETAPKVDLDIAFERGEARLLPAGVRQLDALASALHNKSLAAQRFVIAGHTDQEGSADYNDRLSCERALAARRYLAEHHHIESASLIPMGFGYTKLKMTSDPLAAENRRVEIRRYAEGQN